MTAEQYRVIIAYELAEIERLKLEAGTNPDLRKKERRTVVIKNRWD